MTPLIESLIKAIKDSPNPLTTIGGLIGGFLVAYDLTTVDALAVWLNDISWNDLYRTCLGILMACGGKMMFTKQEVRISYVTPEDKP